MINKNPQQKLWVFFYCKRKCWLTASNNFYEKTSPDNPFKIPIIRGGSIPIIRGQTISIANTKNVNTKGKSKVNQGQCVATAKTVSATDKKNNSQYMPLFLFLISIAKILAKIVAAVQSKRRIFGPL